MTETAPADCPKCGLPMLKMVVLVELYHLRIPFTRFAISLLGNEEIFDCTCAEDIARDRREASIYAEGYEKAIADIEHEHDPGWGR